MTYKLNMRVKIDPKLTAKDWELYSDMKGVGEVARNMNSVLKSAVNAKDSTPLSVTQEMHKVMREFSSFGAYDTEPCATLRHILRKVYGETILD